MNVDNQRIIYDVIFWSRLFCVEKWRYQISSHKKWSTISKDGINQFNCAGTMTNGRRLIEWCILFLNLLWVDSIK